MGEGRPGLESRRSRRRDMGEKPARRQNLLLESLGLSKIRLRMRLKALFICLRGEEGLRRTCDSQNLLLKSLDLSESV